MNANHNLTDEEILVRSIKEPELFELLIDRYQAALLRKAEKILYVREDAEDVVQETFVRIYIAAGRFRVTPGAVFSSWAYKILINQCMTVYKKKKKIRSATTDIDTAEEGTLVDLGQVFEHESKLSVNYITSLISKLPNVLARVLTLHFIEGKSHGEIAREEQISENLARVRLHRAKAALRKVIAPVQ